MISWTLAWNDGSTVCPYQVTMQHWYVLLILFSLPIQLTWNMWNQQICCWTLLACTFTLSTCQPLLRTWSSSQASNPQNKDLEWDVPIQCVVHPYVSPFLFFPTSDLIKMLSLCSTFEQFHLIDPIKPQVVIEISLFPAPIPCIQTSIPCHHYQGRPGRHGAGKLHPPGDFRWVQPGGTDHPCSGASLGPWMGVDVEGVMCAAKIWMIWGCWTINVGIAIIHPPCLMVYTTHLWTCWIYVFFSMKKRTQVKHRAQTPKRKAVSQARILLHFAWSVSEDGHLGGSFGHTHEKGKTDKKQAQ